MIIWGQGDHQMLTFAFVNTCRHRRFKLVTQPCGALHLIKFPKRRYNFASKRLFVISFVTARSVLLVLSAVINLK